MAEADPAGKPGQEGQQPGAASQQPAAGSSDGGKDKGTPETVSRAELNTVIGERQAAKERARKAEEAIAEMQKKLEAMPAPEVLEQFNTWRADKSAQARDAAIKKGDVEAIEKGIREPLEGQVKALRGRNENLQAQLTSLLRDAALQDAAAQSGAHNPRQVVMLLRDRVRMAEQDGRFVPDFRDADGQPLYDGDAKRVTDASSFVRMFLALPDNANLVKAGAQPGSGARPPGGPANPPDGLPKTLADFNALPPEKRQEIAQKMTPDQRREFMGVKVPGKGGFM